MVLVNSIRSGRDQPERARGWRDGAQPGPDEGAGVDRYVVAEGGQPVFRPD
jgi:hypothetical protein